MANGSGTALTFADRLANFLSEHRGQAFCLHCLAVAIGDYRQTHDMHVQRAMRNLGTTHGFWRDRGICAHCGNDREVIWTLWPGFQP